MGLGARLAVVFALMAATTALLVGGATYVTTDLQVLSEVDRFLEERAEEITGGQRSQPRNRRDRNADDPVDLTSPDAEVQILDQDGNILTNSGLVLPVDDIDRDLAGDNGTNKAVFRTISIEGVQYRVITDNLSGGGAVQVARSLDESVGLVQGLQTRILVVAGTLAGIAAALGWIVAQRTTRPLRALTEAVDEVAATRNFDVPVPTEGNDEVGRLGRGFNRMLSALEMSQEQQKRLVQDTAHELRTPLTSITANVEWLMRAPDLDASTRSETLGGVRRELGELNDLMAEIIELATDSHEPAPLTEIEMSAVVTEAVEQFRRRTGRTVSLQTTPAMVLGDPDSLARAVTNLLSNAHKYSPSASSIEVLSEAGTVVVNDAGEGIPPEDRDRIFDRFYRRDSDRSKPGSGLGLSIVSGIVELHGGAVFVGSSPLGGAQVGFRLPTA